MARRGEVLHEHILDAAKLVFLEAGFERTSMDAVANRAATSKRSLYAHFPTKDALFLACIDRSHELFEGRLQTPSHYADDPDDAVARYCGRLLQLLRYAPVVQMCRIGVTEAARLPAAAARIYETFLGTPQRGLAAHLAAHRGLDAGEAVELAERLLGAIVYPALSKALFGVRSVVDTMPDEAALGSDVDLDAVQSRVAAVLGKAAPPTSDGGDRAEAGG